MELEDLRVLILSAGKIDDELTRLEEQKLKLVRLLYKIDEHYDIEELNTFHGNLLNKSKELEIQLKEDKEYKETLRPMYMEYHKKLSEIDEEKIQEDYEEWKEAKQYLT